MSSPPLELQYDRPLQINEFRVTRNGSELTIQVGPPSTAQFSGAIAVAAVLMIFCVFGVAAVILRTADVGPKAMFMFPVGLIVSVAQVIGITRQRRATRCLLVRGGLLHFQMAPEKPLFAVPAERCRRLVVRRCWWRPWLVELQAAADRPFFSLHAVGGNDPITVLASTNRKQLDCIAAELREALGMERDATVR